MDGLWWRGNKKDDGTFTFNRGASTCLPPPKCSSQLQEASPTTATPHSRTRDAITPPTADVIEEIEANQRTTPRLEGVAEGGNGSEGTGDENGEYRCRWELLIMNQFYKIRKRCHAVEELHVRVKTLEWN